MAPRKRSTKKDDKPKSKSKSDSKVKKSRRPEKHVMTRAHHMHHTTRPTFPVQKVHYILESLCPLGAEILPETSIYLNAVLEYVAAEILENAGHQARIHSTGPDIRISEANIMEVIAIDEALHQLVTCGQTEKGHN